MLKHEMGLTNGLIWASNKFKISIKLSINKLVACEHC